MDPPVHSAIARKYGLHISLLERLYDHEVYDSGVGTLCRTLLTENHRSQEKVRGSNLDHTIIFTSIFRSWNCHLSFSIEISSLVRLCSLPLGLRIFPQSSLLVLVVASVKVKTLHLITMSMRLPR